MWDLKKRVNIILIFVIKFREKTGTPNRDKDDIVTYMSPGQDVALSSHDYVQNGGLLQYKYW